MENQSHQYSRRDFIQRSSSALALAAGAQAISSPLYAPSSSLLNSNADTRPNIIFAMADDLGWGDLAYNGVTTKCISTPHFDQWAKDGVKLNHFYACSSVCSPTRAGCMTGRNPSRFGIIRPSETLNTDELCYSQLLKDAGYATAHFGKWHIGDGAKKGPFVRGFDEVYVKTGNSKAVNPTLRYWGGDAKPGDTHQNISFQGEESNVLVDLALDFVEKHKSTSPFFINLWFPAPHTPYGSTQEYLDKFENDSSCGNISGNKTRAALINALDDAMKALRDGLKEKGVAENTIVLFCSDNGGPDGGVFTGSKLSEYEGGHRSPGLLEWPAQFPEPFETDLPMSTLDLFPTFLAAAGVDHSWYKRPLDGHNVLPMLKQRTIERPPIPFNHGPKGVWSVRDGDYKYYTDFEGRSELYNVILDTKENENTNIVSEHPEIVSKLRDYLTEWKASVEHSQTGKDYSEWPLDQTTKLVSSKSLNNSDVLQLQSVDNDRITFSVLDSKVKVQGIMIHNAYGQKIIESKQFKRVGDKVKFSLDQKLSKGKYFILIQSSIGRIHESWHLR